MKAQAQSDPILAEHFQKIEAKSKATGRQVRGTYVSHRIQNELVDIIGQFLEQRVLDRVKSCWFFSILADECRDSSGKEMMALFFRYVWKDPVTGLYTVEEDFVQFLHCPKVTGEGLFQVLMDYTTAKGIPMQNGRAQGYDGGGNMAGKNNGLRARVEAAYPKMPYQWCRPLS